MRILVFGSTGQLGQCFKEIHKNYPEHDFVFLTRHELDLMKCCLEDKTRLSNYFRLTHPDIVINCAGYTDVEKAEYDTLNCFTLNALVPQEMALRCKEQNIKFIHFSTDYVFNGTKKGEYVEGDDIVFQRATNFYGFSKQLGEQYVLHENPVGFIIRISGLVSTYGKNFVKTMIKKFQDNANFKDLKVVRDQWTKLTSGHDLAEFVMHLINDYECKPQCMIKGPIQGIDILHYGNAPSNSWYYFARLIQEKMIELEIPNECTLIPVDTDKESTIAKRPQNSVLNNLKTIIQYNDTPGLIDDTIKRIIQSELKENCS